MLAVSIGIGSALFHTFATTWARLLDVNPILLFQLLFLWLYTRHVMELPAALAAATVVIFLATGLVARQLMVGGGPTVIAVP